MWLLREISRLTVTALYIPPQADTDLALGKLFEAVNRQEATSIVIGDFNKAEAEKSTTHYQRSNSALQDCFDDTDWEMFREASNNNIDEYTDSVIWFIIKCIEDVVPTKTDVYPNQKPWLNCEVHAAFKEGNTDEYKKASYALYELNAFYTRFEANHTTLAERFPTPITAESTLPSVPVAEVCRAFKCVNILKAAGPDGIPAHAIKAFVPMCFKLATTVPVPKSARINILIFLVALSSIMSNCFEKLVRDIMCSSLPATLVPLQFAYRQNRSTDDATRHPLSPCQQDQGAQSGLQEARESAHLHHHQESHGRQGQQLPIAQCSHLRGTDMEQTHHMCDKKGMNPRILRTFYTCTVESVLTGSITTWYGNCTATERKTLQRVVRTAQHITGVQLPNLLDLYTATT
ncbi:hypothetical protein MHYP_G00009230 [Metynnis hypsauchen]